MSLYTKYRPQDFENLVWQSFVKETLKKAIMTDKTVWSYLFCWPRWTWKTSSARLFAKTINCLDLKDWNPCNKCKNCEDFKNDKLIDIVEIDAASHTWVDNVRELIEKAKFLPSQTKYKIYIIDEVHMLSKSAFNALLKILEEPPTHVKFILATTETHKVPETIISRCQKYDFRRIDNESLRNRLLFIANSENVKIDEKSLDYIVSSSNWWLRNAISLFEQLIENSEVVYEKIVEKLWISSEEELEKFISKLENLDISIIEDFEKKVDSGKNLKLFFKELIFKTKEKIILNLKENKDISTLVKIFENLDETYWKTKNSLDEDTTFLVWILKIIWWVNNSPLGNKPITSEKIIIQEKKETIIPENKVEEKIFSQNENSFSLDTTDLDDIFGEEESFSPKTEEKKFLEPKKEVNFWNFSAETFVAKIKENWWNWALTMSLRAANFWKWENILEITPANKMWRLNISKVENLPIMMKSLEDLGFENYKITII